MNSKILHFSRPMFMLAVCLVLGTRISPAQETETKPMVRLICVGGLGEAEEVALATKSEGGKWKKITTTELREPMVSNWLPSQTGEIHILRQINGQPQSLVHFTHAEGTRRALVVLTADEEAKSCRAVVVDPDKEGFKAGTTIILNASKVTGTVSLGTESQTVEAGKYLVTKATPDENGGYRVMVHGPGEQDTKQLCYDRQVVANPQARNIIVLLPDPSVTLRVTSLSEFGPFD